MKILVTGGAGFIGSHIVEAYLKLGHEVAVVDDLSVGNKENLAEGVKLFEVNLVNEEALAKVFQEFEPEVVNHLAAQKSVTVSVDRPAQDANINIIGGLNLLGLANKYKVKKVIFSSTGGAIYGDAEIIPTPETYDAKPESPYGIAKLTMEHYLRFYRDTYGLKSVILRYSNVYGPRQDPHGEAGVVAIFVQKLIANEKALIFGDGEQTRDFVFVGDVVAANVAALEKGDGEIVNIGTSREVSVREIFNNVKLAVGVEMEPEYREARPGELKRSAIDNSRAKEVLGWSAQVKIEDGIAKTVEWFRKIKN